MDELLLAQTSHFDPAHEWNVDTLRAETSPDSFFFSCCCPIFLSHYVVAATRSLVNAPAPRDGQGFTVMRPARLDTMERDACCFAAAPMELTAILSQAPVYVPRGSRWVPSLLFEVSGSVLLLFETSCFFFFCYLFYSYLTFTWGVYLILVRANMPNTHTIMLYKPAKSQHPLTDREKRKRERIMEHLHFKKKTH